MTIKIDELQKELQKEYAKIVAQTWCDPEFREVFINKPAKILREHGFNIPEDAIVEIFEEDSSSEGTYHFSLPSAPSGFNCSDDEGLNVSHNNCCCCCC